VQHFRTRRGAEVDFVLSVGREFLGIEVKASRHVHPHDLKGFDSFMERARNVTRRIVVFLGARRQRIDGIEALPLDDFLAELPS
jgi:predicted AAA+ superfamily ATPase